MDSKEIELGRRFTVSFTFNKDLYKRDIMGLRGPVSMFGGSTNHQLARYAGRSMDRRKRMTFSPLVTCSLAGSGLPRDRFMNLEALGSIVRNRPNKHNDEGSSGGGNGIDNDEGSSGGNDEGSSGGGNVIDNDEGSSGGNNKGSSRGGNGIDNDEGSCGGGNVQDNDEGSRRRGRGGNDILIRTLVGVGHVIRGVVGLYVLYKIGKSIESTGREIMGAVRGWKEEGFPALANIKFEKVNLVDIKIEKVDLKFSIY